jgi:hypothetical protein
VRAWNNKDERRFLLNPFGVGPRSLSQRSSIEPKLGIRVFRGRPLRLGSERVGRRPVPQTLVLLGHNDSRVLDADLVKVDAQTPCLNTASIFECSDLEGLRVDPTVGDFRVCRVFGFGGFVGCGLYLYSECIGGGDVTYDLSFSRVGLGFTVCCVNW